MGKIMGSEASLQQNHNQQSMQEALDQINDRVERLNFALSDCREGFIAATDTLMAIRIDVHSIKTIGSANDLPVIVVLAHRLEDYLMEVQQLNEGSGLDDVQRFFDLIQEALESPAKIENDAIAALVRKLPAYAPPSFDVEDVVATEVEAMLVVPAGLAGRLIGQELRECGYRLVSVADPFEAMHFAASTRPDVIIVSAILDRLDGIDLVCALKAMPSTGGIAVAFLTSMDHGDERLKLLPEGVPVLYKGPTFADDVATAFSALGII
jgi:CheY-like chemotaxis protein